MLDIRATHYVSPLSEVEFESIPLTVHIVNVADETGLVTGKFRVYNDTTGLLIHTSDIAPLSLAAGSIVDVSALTDFDPPAPADDVYFVIFDGHASNALVPDGINFALGSFDFDVKPVGMGPAPATHHLTHEEGGADEIEVADMGTAELDDTLVLQPDGAGGVAWNAVPAGVTDHGDLTGLGDDDHPQYRLHDQLYIDQEFLQWYDAPYLDDFISGAIAGGLIGRGSLPNHPGFRTLYSSGSAGSGRYITTDPTSLSIGGGETIELIIRPLNLPNLTCRLGLIDVYDTSDCTDGIYFQIAPVGGTDGVVVGSTAASGARSTTASSFTLVASNWYRLRAIVNAAATRVDFYVFSEAGALLWTDSLTTNIPTGATEQTGAGITAFRSDTTLIDLIDIDLIRLWINRTLVR